MISFQYVYYIISLREKEDTQMVLSGKSWDEYQI